MYVFTDFQPSPELRESKPESFDFKKTFEVNSDHFLSDLDFVLVMKVVGLIEI